MWWHVSTRVVTVWASHAEIRGRHVAKTGEIKDFVIIEESGIAKGIRRIIAVTGHEASEVNRQGKALAQQLEDIDRRTGKEKDAGLKAFTTVSVPCFGTGRHSEATSRRSARRTSLSF